MRMNRFTTHKFPSASLPNGQQVLQDSAEKHKVIIQRQTQVEYVFARKPRRPIVKIYFEHNASETGATRLESTKHLHITFIQIRNPHTYAAKKNIMTMMKIFSAQIARYKDILA
ncbi:unnamed protein product [Cercospora beticola]|nr:unnamed protein product [Cercospora beticola]